MTLESELAQIVLEALIEGMLLKFSSYESH